MTDSFVRQSIRRDTAAIMSVALGLITEPLYFHAPVFLFVILSTRTSTPFLPSITTQDAFVDELEGVENV